MGICCMAQETQKVTLCQHGGVGWEVRWEEGSGMKGYMYTYGWLCWDLKENNKILSSSYPSI